MATHAGDTDQPLKQGIGYLTILEKNTKRLKRIKFLGQLFQDNGYELRIAGGAVRDILGGVEPQDIDLATTARPDQSLDILQKHEDIVRIIVTAAGQKHGTVAVKFKEAEIDLKKIKLDHHVDPDNNLSNSDTKLSVSKPKYDEESPYEITTLRRDHVTDGRHAEVEFVNDWKIDAERRDLTINAMFLTLDEGKLIDYFEGEADLKKGVVRFVGNSDARIKEDYLRILRYFRFWSRYGRQNYPDKETRKIISDNLEGLDQISGERLWQEIKKTFSYIPCNEVLKLMLELKLFVQLGLTPDGDYDDYTNQVLARAQEVEKNVNLYSTTILAPRLFKEQNNISTKKIKELLPTIIFSSVVVDSSMCNKAHDRMKFSNIERDSILYIVENREEVQNIKTLKYQLATSMQQDHPHILQKIKTLLIYQGRLDLLEELENWPIPTFPKISHVVAQEIRKRKLPNNKIGTILSSLRDDWAVSDFTLSRQELEQAIKSKLENL